MRTSSKGLDLIRHFEGLRLLAYKCPANVPTIGYGATLDVKMGMEITKEEAERLLCRDVKRFEQYVEKLVTVPLTQGQFDALVAFCYNLGPGNLESSTLLKYLNAGLYQDAALQFLRWNKSNKVALAGLTRRRVAEKALFESAEC